MRSILLFGVLIGISACINTSTDPFAGTPYRAVISCIEEAGYVGTGGSIVTGDETVDEAIALVADNYSLSPTQQANVRACAATRL